MGRSGLGRGVGDVLPEVYVSGELDLARLGMVARLRAATLSMPCGEELGERRFVVHFVIFR